MAMVAISNTIATVWGPRQKIGWLLRGVNVWLSYSRPKGTRILGQVGGRGAP